MKPPKPTPFLCGCSGGNELPGVGNEAGNSLKGNHRGWFIGVIPTHSPRTSKCWGCPHLRHYVPVPVMQTLFDPSHDTAVLPAVRQVTVGRGKKKTD